MTVPDLPARELQCFLVLAEQLHFGRTAEQLYVSQSRVSQLLRSLERRVGAPLVERTSRRVRLTPLGEDFLTSLRPAYAALARAFEQTRLEAHRSQPPLRIGFQGAVYEPVALALARFQEQHPHPSVDLKELPLADPFSDLLAGRIDVAVVLLPVEEPELTTGLVFSREPQTLALAAGHPWARRHEIDADDLSEVPLVAIVGPAPDYWRRVHTPAVTPSGARIRTRGRATTVQEGLTQVASGRGGMLLCAATAAYNRRPDIAFVPVRGLPETALGVTWRADRQDARVEEFTSTLRQALP
ncbi:LysR family transcriptional regulator [Jiangella gansuensis]|uniref:LysR substrate-binding domain-containing protein n=1 Tax=Jiangella gansuensis TaxID=281473 RepID=UPI00047881DD|nr:LysR family transcriptional regulator [Jiangella gansuensis]